MNSTMEEDALQVGRYPAHVIRGALLMRGYTIRRVASDVDVHPSFVMSIIKGHAKSRRVEDHINELLATPVVTLKN